MAKATRCSGSWIRILGLVGLLFALPVEAQDSRAMMPSAEQRIVIRKQLDEGFGVHRAVTTAAKQMLAANLMAKVVNAPMVPKDEVYVALIAVIELNQSVRDLPAMNSAVEKLVTTFDVPAETVRNEYLVEFLKRANWKTAMTLKPALDLVTTRVRAALAEERVTDAEKLLAEVDSVLVQLKVPTSVRRPLSDLQTEVTVTSEVLASYDAATLLLQSSPEDPEANFTIARYLLRKMPDWTIVLSFLRKASTHKEWQAAAALELAPNAEALKVGDAWWTLAESVQDPVKREVLLHAGQWYQQALPSLVGLTKMQTEQRLAEISQAKRPVVSTGNVGPKSKLSMPHDPNALPVGEWVDLLKLVQVPRDVIRGRWRSADGAMIAEPYRDGRFQAPVAVRGSYEVTCDFTRRAGAECIVLTIPVGNAATNVFVSGWGGKASGLHLIDGKELLHQPTNIRSGVRSGLITNGRRSQMHVDVDFSGEFATIKASLDGQRFVDWKGRASQLSSAVWFWRPCAEAIAVTVNDSAADIHKLELKLKPGCRAVRLEDDWKNSVAPVAETPPAEVADKCLKFNGRSYYVTDKPMNRADAQQLAESLQGRLLTISSVEEEAFVIREGRGLWFWMAGWRRSEDFTWKDERSRPLKLPPRWAARQPANADYETFLGILTASTWERGWHDWTPDAGLHVIIEWGEEY